jgi:hypothetical protein
MLYTANDWITHMTLAVVLSLRKPTIHCVPSNSCISVKNTLGRSAVVFCACEAIHVFSVVFYVITVCHKFECRLVINKNF